MTQGDGDVPTNFERLVQHLGEGSLAAQLVRAHHEATPNEKKKSIRTVVQDKLDETRKALDNATT